MRIERVYSTHNTAHEGGNKVHASAEMGGNPLCGATSRLWFSAAATVDIESPDDLAHYVDCLRCLDILKKQMGGA